MCLVAFAGFMRCDELIRLTSEDIKFNTESMVIRIVSSKTYQYQEGSSLVIARTGELTCPVGMMEKPLVKATLKGLRRTLAKPKVRKEPVTADMLRAMVEAAGPAPSLTEVRLLVVCLVAFAGFMRCDELIRLKGEDIIQH